MKKIIRVLVQAEYVTDTDHYDKYTSAEEMAKIDLENDPGSFLTDCRTYEIQEASFVEGTIFEKGKEIKVSP
jgi:hypothetical protein